MRVILFVGILWVSLSLKAADVKYPVSSIPEKLLKNADVVKRNEEVQFEIVGLNETVWRRKVAYTILNENGDSKSGIAVYYDKLRKVSDLDGALYDASGKQLKKIKPKDIQDYSAVQNISLYDDNRVKVYDFNYRSYPYTVEYTVEMRFNNTYSFPDWMPQSAENLSVENSSYTLIAPSDYPVRFKAFNYKEEPLVTTDKNKKIWTWKVSGLPAIKRFYASPNWNELTTAVYFAPSGFEMEGYKGNATTWQDFGLFSLSLNTGRDKLPENILQKVQELTAGITDQQEKVKVLYRFLQQNTRYISVQLGIGGLQPFEAGFVAQKGYGDCKALSNYMYSLLKAADIKSYYTLVNGGRDSDDKYMIDDFPSDQFNHVILCVPLQRDTMWLECTSQTVAPGYMGGFTGNRKALLITEEGGKLVSTPRYGIKENTQIRTIQAKVKDDGTLDFKAETVYSGIEQDELEMRVANSSKDEVKKNLEENLQLATYLLNNFKYEEEKNLIPRLREKLDVTVNNYATITGKRLFITPNILNRGGARLLEEEGRTVDYVFDYEFHNEDSEEIEIPEGYGIEAAPQEVSIKTKYGIYYSSAKVVGNKILYKRVREQFAGRFSAKEQKEIIQFFEDIYKADRNRIVLVKKA
jgi:hypothetical protein